MEHPTKAEDIRPGQVYRHFKGHMVQIICMSLGTEDGNWCVVYRHMKEGTIWHRPLGMFLSEVDREEHPEAEQKYRFELVENPE